MPNWVYNSLTIEGSRENISDIKKQLNTPFTREHENWNMETKQMETKEYQFDNPVFAFWNIIRPLDMEAYAKQPDHSLPAEEALQFKGDNWYDWNVRNWGTKWDVAVSNDEKYPETDLYMETEDTLGYRFNTAWSPPAEAIAKLSEQYPDVSFELSFEEETGWGGEIVFENGEGAETESYNNKCRDCDSLDTLEYCEEGCGEICDDCHYLGEADLDCVAECPTHAVYLDSEHVPDYRMRETDV